MRKVDRHPSRQSRTERIFSAAFPYTERRSAEARPCKEIRFQYMSYLHRLSCGWQQCKQAACKQKIKPAIGSGNGIARPQAAGDPKDILHRHIAQYPNVEIPHLTRCSRLYLRISKTPDRMIRNNDHHATPEQIGENIPKSTVKYTKRNADQRSYQRFPCRKVSFLCRGKGVLQKIKENHASYPAEL